MPIELFVIENRFDYVSKQALDPEVMLSLVLEKLSACKVTGNGSKYCRGVAHFIDDTDPKEMTSFPAWDIYSCFTPDKKLLSFSLYRRKGADLKPTALKFTLDGIDEDSLGSDNLLNQVKIAYSKALVDLKKKQEAETAAAAAKLEDF